MVHVPQGGWRGVNVRFRDRGGGRVLYGALFGRFEEAAALGLSSADENEDKNEANPATGDKCTETAGDEGNVEVRGRLIG